MKWNDQSISVKVSVSATIVMLLIIATCYVSYTGASKIVKSAEQIIERNKLRAVIAQMEVHQLNWVNQLSLFLADEEGSIEIETDYLNSDFGKWLNSNKRKKAEMLYPDLTTLLKKIEKPLKVLYTSADQIKKIFEKPHTGFFESIIKQKMQYIKFVADVGLKLAIETGGLFTYQSQIKVAIEQVISLINSVDSNTSYPTLEEKQKHIKELIRSIRFGKDGYVFIHSFDMKCVLLPPIPELENTDLSDLKDKKGKYIVRGFRDICTSEKGEGFIVYHWYLPGTKVTSPKLTFMKAYKPWKWMIGTGVYINSSNANILKRADDFANGKPFKLDIEEKCNLENFLQAESTINITKEHPEYKKVLDSLRKPHKDLINSFKQIEKHISDLEVIRAIDVFLVDTRNALDQLEKIFEQATRMESLIIEKADRANEIFASTIIPNLHDIQKIFNQIRMTMNINMKDNEYLLNIAKKTQQIVVTVSIIIILLSILIGIIVTKSTISPLKKGAQFAQIVSKGDFTQSIHIKQNDEVGKFINSLNSLVVQFRKLVSDIILKSKELAGASENMVSISKNLANDAQEMNNKSNSVAVASEEMTTNITVMATSVEEMSANISSVAKTTEQMSENILSVSNSIDTMSLSMTDIRKHAHQGTTIAGEATTMAESAANTMKSLGDSAIEIGEVTEVIKRIAQKTDLLAVNAAIEASSAGEAGKGFAVVSNEITKFADQSARAAEDIAKRISKVQENADDAIKVIADISEIVSDINSSSKIITKSVEEQTNAAASTASNVAQASTGTSEIATSMQEMSAGSNEVSKNLSEAARSTKEVAKNIQQVNLSVIKTRKSSMKVNKAASELSTLSNSLLELVKNFKVQ